MATKRADPPPCYQKAIELLARRAHFERELTAKLTQRGYDDDEVAATLERLVGEGLVDDAATARSFIQGRLARGPLGRAKLRAELGRRGVDGEVARAAIEEAGLDDLAAARAAGERWLRRGGRSAASLARHLAGRGFPGRAIVPVLRALDAGDADDAIAALADLDPEAD